MQANSKKTRGVVFAFLFGPPRLLSRAEATRIHDALCTRLGFDDLALRYRPIGNSETPGKHGGFKIEIVRPEGRGGLSVQIICQHQQAPIKLLMEYTYPPAFESVKETMDEIDSALFEVLEEYRFQKVLAEARLRVQCSSSENSGLKFMTEQLLGSCQDWVKGFGEGLVFSSISLQSRPQFEQEFDSLQGPSSQMQVEVLREDPRSLYVEFVVSWSQMDGFAGETPMVSPDRVRRIDKRPSEYLETANEILEERLASLGKKGN